MKKLNLKEELTNGVTNIIQKIFASAYPIDNKKNEYELEYQQHKIRRFGKLSTAKKIATINS